MRARVVDPPGPIDDHPLELAERPIPVPRTQARTHVRRVSHGPSSRRGRSRAQTCERHSRARGCRHGRVLGNGRVASASVTASVCRGLRTHAGACRFCRAAKENLCISPSFTGWDVDGGYAEYLVVDETYAYELPSVFGDEEATPLLCAGLVPNPKAILRPGQRLERLEREVAEQIPS